MNVYSILRPLLFCLDPELSHNLALKALSQPWLIRLLSKDEGQVFDDSNTPLKINNLLFRNRLGLAAGADKNAIALAGWEQIGFGFVEVGTVTPLPQPGNLRPRVWRFPRQRALVNAMGFPNDGAEKIASRLAKWRLTHPLGNGMLIGVNCGKQKSTTLEFAARDYISVMRTTWNYADFFVINVSSPNTKGLRELQKTSNITSLLKEIIAARDKLTREKKSSVQEIDPRRPPLWVKISPDIEQTELAAIAKAIAEIGADAIVATNTTTDLRALNEKSATNPNITGGLSGAPLLEKSLQTVRTIRAVLPADFPVIGCGGISCEHCANKMREAGSDMLEIYTTLVYSGPSVVRKILKNLR